MSSTWRLTPGGRRADGNWRRGRCRGRTGRVEALTPSFFDTGVFTVRPGEHADRLRVARRCAVRAASAAVLLQFLDQNGGVVLQKNVSLSPGKSTKMQVVNGRAATALHARVLDAPRRVRRATRGDRHRGDRHDDFVFPTAAGVQHRRQRPVEDRRASCRRAPAVAYRARRAAAVAAIVPAADLRRTGRSVRRRAGARSPIGPDDYESSYCFYQADGCRTGCGTSRPPCSAR